MWMIRSNLSNCVQRNVHVCARMHEGARVCVTEKERELGEEEEEEEEAALQASGCIGDD